MSAALVDTGTTQASLGSMQLTGGSQDSSSAGTQKPKSQVGIVFETDLQDSLLRLPDALQSTELLLPSDLTRRGLSELLNHLLELEDPVLFDFLVKIPDTRCMTQEDNGKADCIFLRTSLARFMRQHHLTAETRLVLIYTVARTELIQQSHAVLEDWTVGLSSLVWKCPSSSGNETRFALVAAAGADGQLRLFDASRNAGQEASELVLSRCGSDTALTSSALMGVSVRPTVDGEQAQVLLTSESGECWMGFTQRSVDCITPSGFCVVAKGKSDFGPLTACGFASGGDLAVTAGSNGKVFLWDNVQMEQLVHERCTAAAHHEPETTSGRKRPHRCLEAGGAVVAAQARGVLFGHEARVNSVCQPQSTVWKYHLLSASHDKTVRIWDLPFVTAVATWPTARAASSITSAPGGDMFATSHEDGRVRVWDVRDGSGATLDLSKASLSSDARNTLRTAYHIHRRCVSDVKWSPTDPFTLTSVSHDGYVKLLDIRSPRYALQTVSYPNAKLLCVNWIDERRFITGGSDQQIRSHLVA